MISDKSQFVKKFDVEISPKMNKISVSDMKNFVKSKCYQVVAVMQKGISDLENLKKNIY